MYLACAGVCRVCVYGWVLCEYRCRVSTLTSGARVPFTGVFCARWAYSVHIAGFHVLTSRHERLSCISRHVVHVYAYGVCAGMCVVCKEACFLYVRAFTHAAKRQFSKQFDHGVQNVPQWNSRSEHSRCNFVHFLCTPPRKLQKMNMPSGTHAGSDP